MKKKGFTLAEALIALAIVGIIAAIAAPMINRYKPDEDKITFLRTYDSIVEIINNVANNTHLYPLVDDEGNDYTDNPLENTVTITNYNGTGTSYPSAGNDKLCEILADAFKTTPTTCATGNLTLNNVNFTTSDGVDFYMKGETPKDEEGNETGPYTITIKFDIHGKGQSCVYGETNCEKPNQFEVKVSSAGKVIAADKMAVKYLETRSSYRKTEHDASEAEGASLTVFKQTGDCSMNDYFDDHLVTCCDKYKNETNESKKKIYDAKCVPDPCDSYDPALATYDEIFQTDSNGVVTGLKCGPKQCDAWKNSENPYNGNYELASMCEECLITKPTLKNAIITWDGILNSLNAGNAEKSAEDYYEDLVVSYSGTLSDDEADLTKNTACVPKYTITNEDISYSPSSILEYYKYKIKDYCTDKEHACLTDNGHF